jgi:hypothetical protein
MKQQGLKTSFNGLDIDKPKGFKKESVCTAIKTLDETIAELQFCYKTLQPNEETEESALFYLMEYQEMLKGINQ